MDEDLRALERATAATPQDASAWLRLAVALERLGRPHACLAAARRSLSLDRSSREATELSRRAFREVAKPLSESELRSAIGRALRQPGPYENAPGWDLFELLAGTLDPTTGAVAWVEDRTRPRRVDPSPVHIECHTELRIARAGREVLTWPLEHYNPFFETRVHHLHLEDNRATVVYREKHRIVAAVVPFVGLPRFVWLGSLTPILVVPDRVFFADDEADGSWHVSGYSLPDLSPCPRRPLSGEFDMKESIGYEFFLGRAPSPGNRPMRIVGDELLVPLVGGKEDRIPLRGLVPST